MTYEKIPQELRELAAWVTWRFEDRGGTKPTKVPYDPRSAKRAAVNNPFEWTTYPVAVAAVKQGLYDGIGFVLSSADPYTFIDLDDVHGDKEAMDRQLKIFQSFDSYSEVSPSGNGLHIIVKGDVPTGRKRAYVEIYSTARFMTMTGNVYRDTPIHERNALANGLWEQMGGAAQLINYAGDAAEKAPDQEILNRAAQADNGAKFVDLWFGRWSLHYSSQSEADLAIINIIAFYTQNKMQIARLFHTSDLGKRPKALRVKYVDYMVNKAFDRMLPPIDLDGMKIALDEQFAASQSQLKVNPFDPVPAPEAPPPFNPVPPVEIEERSELLREAFVYERPPGLVGEIANFMYAAAPRPVPEIALVGALSLMSGICGRAYNISGMGLNQYLLLLAPTGSGKESIASGTDRIMAAVSQTVPASGQFIGPAEIASPEALLKYFGHTSNSFVSMIGEFALKLKQMSMINASPQHAGLKRLYLDLFNKSGKGKELQPIIYSDKQKNTEKIMSPSFSIMGESAPERFYETLNEGMISEGLLPRFTIVEYRGNRPPLNEEHQSVQPSPHLIEQLTGLCGHALTLNHANTVIDVKLDPAAKLMFRAFDTYCDKRINDGGKELARQLWNRCHVKALKLSALLAVGNNPFDPIVNEYAADWAIKMVVNDTTKLLERFDAGEVGTFENSDVKQVEKLVESITHYLTAPYSELKKYVVTPTVHASKVIPYSYISRRLAPDNSFRTDKLGATQAIRKCIQVLIDRGDIQELSSQQRSELFKTTAKCYVVANPKAFRTPKPT